jgi:acyl dehydratase
MPGLYFEEFEVGSEFEHGIRRTVTETDNLLFTTMTHNPAALHLDAEYCSKTEFGQILVNSLFTLSLVVGISVNDTTQGTTVANLGFGAVSFPAPVFIGDTLTARTVVKDTRPSKSRPGQGIVTFEHSATNQRGETVVVAERRALMLGRT